ncbi:hypothetical protein ACHAWF_005486 [Thalassiosira exigua]
MTNESSDPAGGGGGLIGDASAEDSDGTEDARAPAAGADPPAEAAAAASENAPKEDGANKNAAGGGDPGEGGDEQTRAAGGSDGGEEGGPNPAKEDEEEGKEGPTDPPSKEVKLEDLHNPRNMTWDELEMMLYEWEEGAGAVDEYLDMAVIEKLRRGETDDDEEENEEDGEEEKKEGEDKEKVAGENAGENEGKQKDLNETEHIVKENEEQKEEKAEEHQKEEGTPKAEEMPMIEKEKEEEAAPKPDEEKSKEEEKPKESKGFLDKLKDNLKPRDDGKKTHVEVKKGQPRYLNLTQDSAHVVEFYAPWCPHCQNYKWTYVDIATEVKRRSISPVQFHAVSCDIYYAICRTYGIEGYPTVLGWKQGDNITQRSVFMNEETDIDPDLVGEMLDLDMAHEEVELFDWEMNATELKAVEEKLEKLGKSAAATKRAWHEHESHTRDDRYRNAALSLAFAIKSQLFQTSSKEGEMEPRRRAALVDFLNLLEWAAPQSWRL